jgi:hypothetical protein
MRKNPPFHVEHEMAGAGRRDKSEGGRGGAEITARESAACASERF